MDNGVNKYLVGNGKTYVAKRDANGASGVSRWIGDSPKFELGFGTERLTHKESFSGKNSTVLDLVTELTASLGIQFTQFSKENLALALQSIPTAIAAGVDVVEIAPDDLVNGDRVALGHQKISGVTIQDSAGVPVEVDAADYEVDADFGAVTFKDVTGYEQPFVITYDHAELTSVAFFTAEEDEYEVRFEGINKATGKKYLAVLYRVRFTPAKTLALISGNEVAKPDLDGTALIDANKPVDPKLGQFGRYIDLT